MKEAWICPKCNIGVAPHCDVCPNCENNLNLLGIPIKIDPTLPPDKWRLITPTGATTSGKYKVIGWTFGDPPDSISTVVS